MAGLKLYGTKIYALILTEDEDKKYTEKAKSLGGIRKSLKDYKDKKVVAFLFHNTLLMKPKSIEKFDELTTSFVREKDFCKYLLNNFKGENDEFSKMLVKEINEKYLSFIVDLRLYKFKKYKDLDGNVCEGNVFNSGILYNKDKDKIKESYIINEMIRNGLNERFIDEFLKDQYLSSVLEKMFIHNINDPEKKKYILEKKRIKEGKTPIINDIIMKDALFPRLNEYNLYFDKKVKNELTKEDKDYFEVSILPGMINSMKKVLKTIFSSRGSYSYLRHVYINYIRFNKKSNFVIPQKVKNDLDEEINKTKKNKR